MATYADTWRPIAVARWVCRILGVSFLIVALAGFMSSDHVVLGVFHVNTMHNIVHLLSGAVLLALGFAAEPTARAGLWVFAAVYGLVAILGLLNVQWAVELLMLNDADDWLHVAITAIAAGGAAVSMAQAKAPATVSGTTASATTNPPTDYR